MESYDLELEHLASIIKEEKANSVLVQLPDGLKPKAKEIYALIREKFGDKVNVIFWAGSCFGACDTPQQINCLGADILVQFGHSEWN